MMKTTRSCLMFVLVTSLFGFAQVQQPAKVKPAKVTVMLRGVVTDRCEVVLREALSKVKGIKFDINNIGRGKKPHFYTDPPFPIEITDKTKTDIGAVAKAVADAETPHKPALPPSLNLILYLSDPITERSLGRFLKQLDEVEGVAARERPGGFGVRVGEGYLWIRLDDTGAAKLEEILNAAKKAELKVSLKRKE